jgi:hypothetical protein
MVRLSSSFLSLGALCATSVFASPALVERLVSTATSSAPTASATSVVNQTVCNGKTYTYNALAGYGFLSGSAVDKFGDTLGGYGSAIAVDKSKWVKNSDGTYNGVVWVLPDRGW